MPHITIKTGVTIHYQHYGEGPDLVLIGGLAADHTTWMPILKMLSKKYRVLVFDNRDVGQTKNSNGSYTIKDMADDVVALMDALSIEKATMVGHSLGGAITMQMCLANPSRIDKAVICASAAKLPLPSLLHVRSIIHLREVNINPELIYETTFPWIFGESYLSNKKMVSAIVKNILNNPYQQTLESFKNQARVSELINLVPELHKVAVKALVIAGRNDLITPAYCSELIHREIKGSQLVVIDDCGHMLQFEQPEILVNTILKFIEKTSTTIP